MSKARFYSKTSYGKVICHLCPHKCTIAANKYGLCGARQNNDGELMANMYGVVSSIATDPIEKKPLYHFFPGRQILSLGSFGCNLTCKCCQNHQISQIARSGIQQAGSQASPKQIAKLSLDTANNIGVAFTYNEPTVWLEYMMDIATCVKKNQQHTVMVSNGFISKQPLYELFGVIDAFNIDLKTYDYNDYKTYFGGGFDTVFENIQTIYKAQKHIEITYLVIDGLNDKPDSFKQLIEKLVKVSGKNIVLHISKSFPRYKSDFEPTPNSTIQKFYEIASTYLNYVYLGNVEITETNNTYCSGCKKILINRSGYQVVPVNLDRLGNCCNCGTVSFKYY